MCGRFSLRVEMEELLAFYGLTESAFPYTKRYNIAPGQMITAVIDAGGQRRIGPLRWGLVPSWANDEKIGFKMINAKAETVAEKPAFRLPFARKRCVVPADGFYEWRKEDKQPYRFTMKDGSLFSLAALYDTWMSPGGTKLHSCTILTTQPNGLTRMIHDRMPVILAEEQTNIWLDRSITDMGLLQPLLVPYPDDEMVSYPVSPIVGNVKNDIPSCLEPL